MEEKIKEEILEAAQEIAHQMHLKVLDVINQDFPKSDAKVMEKLDYERWQEYIIALEMVASMILTHVIANKYVNYKDSTSEANCIKNTIKNVKEFIKIYLYLEELKTKENLKEKK